jgi:hypothetical protein
VVLPYIVSFLGLALFPLALGGYGGHLATLALPEGTKRKRALWLVWGLASLGVLFAGLQQIEAFRSDKEHDSTQVDLQSKLATSLQRQEYTRGQLDSISLMIGGRTGGDPALGQLAAVIGKMADTARLQAPASSVIPDLHLRLLYEGADLQGRTLLVGGTDPKLISLSEFQIHNGADRDTGIVSLRLYLSKQASVTSPPTISYPWQTTPSDEVGFPTAFYSGGTLPQVIINSTETWNWSAFSARLPEDLDEISAKLKVFYGSAKPSEATFIIRRKK